MSRTLYLHGSSLFLAEAGLPVFSKTLPLCCPAVIRTGASRLGLKLLQAKNCYFKKFRFNWPPSSFGKTGSSFRATLNLLSASSGILMKARLM